MAIDLVFKVPMLLRNSIGIQKSALTKRSFGFSIQLMFFSTVLLVHMPMIDQSESFLQITDKSDNFLPTRVLLPTHVTIFNPSESS